MRIFIGSSTEAVENGTMDEVAGWIEESGMYPITWKAADSFVLGDTTIASLHYLTNKVDAATFIFSEDDKVWYRGSEKTQPRDNVLFEYGLFSGALGASRCIIIKRGDIKIPSDAGGINMANFDKPVQAKRQVRVWLTALKEEAKKTRGLVLSYWDHKWAMPEPNAFWRGKSSEARKRFFLVGETNKSWIHRDMEQTNKFAASIIRIIECGGTVGIVSNNTSIDKHQDFIRLIVNMINQYPKEQRQTIKRNFGSQFQYAVANNTNYKAVMSDNNLYLMPSLVSMEFRDESMVVELTEGTHACFDYYLQDILRVIHSNKNVAIVTAAKEQIRD